MLWLVTASRTSSTPTRARQFTGSAFTGVLADNGIAISMDGKGAWRNNVFVERLWRSVKYEEVYLRAYEASATHAHPSEATSALQWTTSTLEPDGMTPDRAYLQTAALRLAA